MGFTRILESDRVKADRVNQLGDEISAELGSAIGQNASDLNAHKAESASQTAKGHVQLQTVINSSEITAMTPNGLLLHQQNNVYHKIQDGGLVSNVDYNSLTANRLYQVADTTGGTNAPPDPYGVLMYVTVGGFGYQFYNSVFSGKTYIRMVESGIWKAWVQL